MPAALQGVVNDGDQRRPPPARLEGLGLVSIEPVKGVTPVPK
ncbi:MAG TPA: hypothetical protein VI030_03360 [Propionibacteriaceae bacterium]